MYATYACPTIATRSMTAYEPVTVLSAGLLSATLEKAENPNRIMAARMEYPRIIPERWNADIVSKLYSLKPQYR